MDRLYFIKNTLIRKEHFGILVLTLDGRRFVIDDIFFELLKELHGNTIEKLEKDFIRFEKSEIPDLISSLVDKGIVKYSKNIIKSDIKFIENDFISNDCLSFPRTVYWETSGLCNFKCLHCYSQIHNDSNRGLDLETVKKLVDEMVSGGVEFFNIGGGEPLLYENIFEAIRYCSDSGLTVEMTSNGSLLTDENIQKLKSAGLKFIQISIDGANKDTFEKIRVGSDFGFITKVIKKLVNNGFIVSINTVLTKINYKEISDIIRLSSDLGASFYKVSPLMETGRGRLNKNKLKLNKEELRSVYKEIINYQKQYKKGDIKVIFNINLIKPKIKNLFWLEKGHYGCPAGRTTCGIDAYGNVFPCSYMNDKELSCGNIKTDSLKEIWKKSKPLKDIRNVVKLEGKCSECKYLDICSGGCRAAGYFKKGSLDYSDPLCVVKK